MKKPSKKIFFSVLWILVLALFLNKTTKAFSDVNSLDKYFTALEYLVKKGVIEGYPDGTFQTSKKISRAEFLKIALNASKISTVKTLETSGFTDIDKKNWYAPFIEKAKKKGWISGYIDGTFKPEQAITRAEALKIIAKIQNWQVNANIAKAPFRDTPLLAWYTPYVAYAKDKNFLGDTSILFRGENFISRGAVAEILFRIAIAKENNVPAFSSELIGKTIMNSSVVADQSSITTNLSNETTEEEANFKPVDFATISQNFFSNVHLEEDFPNTFYLHEVYFFKGKIKNPLSKKVFIFLTPENENKTTLEAGSFTEYSTEPANDGSFQLPVIFRKTGNYRLGLIVGNSGESKVTNISVLANLPKLETTPVDQTSKTLAIQYGDGKTTLRFDTAPQQFSKINFYQDNQQQYFFFRQPVTSFDLPFEDFTNFKEGNVNISLQTASLDKGSSLHFSSGWSLPKNISFTSTQHYTTFNHKDKLKYLTVSETLPQLSSINVSATANTDILAKGAIIKPDGSVEIIPLETSATPKTENKGEIISANNAFRLNYSPKSSGVYIVEVNDSSGEAVINMPIYIQSGIPLLPDFFDLYQPEKNKGGIDLSSARQELLNLINKERNKMGLSSVSQQDDLNNLAQLYTEDMKKRNFFGHINPDNQNPDDRRKAAGIPTVVGENLALAPTIEFAHQGLMRSATHRQNIFNPEWQNIGLGITLNGNSILISEEFAPKPLTTTDVTNLKKNIIDQIKQKRTAQGLKSLQEDTFLSSQAQVWSNKMVNENFFTFASPNGENLSNFFNNYPSIVQAYIVSSNSPEKIIQQITENKQIIDSSWNILGFGLDIDKTGLLKGTLLLTNY